MTEKFKEIIKKCLPALKIGFDAVKKAAKQTASFIKKLCTSIARWAKPHLVRLGEYLEPKLIRALDITIKKLEAMSADYEERRIARSKLTKKEKLLRYFPRVTVASLILLGVLYIIGVYHLYLTGGDAPFSRESVGSYLIILAIPSAITVIMLIVNAILAKVFPKAGDDKYDGVAAADFKLEARLEKLNTPKYNRAMHKQDKMQEHAKALKRQ